MFANHRAILAGLLSAQVVLTAGLPAYAAEVKQITMEINQSYYLNINYQIKRVSLANPNIADIKLIGDGALNIVALQGGSTALTVWLANGNMLEYNITVVPSDKGFAEAIRKAIDLPGVIVEKVGDNILLKGIVKNQHEMDRAVKIASLYVGNYGTGNGAQTSKSNSETTITRSTSSSSEEPEGAFKAQNEFTNENVINLLEIAEPVQINLEALVLDISSTDSSNIGIQYAPASGVTLDTTSGFSSVTFGTAGTFYAGQNIKHYTGRSFTTIDAQIQALVQNGKARILSRPNISTLSGKVAKIHIGGEIAVPSLNGSGSSSYVSMEWKEYGIKLNVQPTADSEGNITSQIFTEVSSIDYDHATSLNGTTVPAIATRKAESILNVPSGMTMVIGGLLNSQEGKTIKKIPLLGDIPIIGEFFKHTSKTKDKREMMILIKPVIVNENTPAKMSQQMEDYYRNDQKESETRNEVDLNETVEEEETIETDSQENVVNTPAQVAPAVQQIPTMPTIPAPRKLSNDELNALIVASDSVQLQSVPQVPEAAPEVVASESETSDDVSALMKQVADKQNEVNELMKKIAEKQEEVNSIMNKVVKKSE